MGSLLPRLLWVAVIAGIAGGLVATVLYGVWSAPLILEAETHEVAAADHDHSQDHAHAWAPADGWQRFAATTLAQSLLGFGGALVIAAVLTMLRRAGWRNGLWVGVAAFVALHLAPALSMPPELPGAVVAPLLARQTWWVLTVAATLTAIVLVVTRRDWRWRAGAVALAALPHVIGAPMAEPGDSAVPGDLHAAFISASLATAVAFWLVVGALSGYLSERFGLALPSDGDARLAADRLPKARGTG